MENSFAAIILAAGQGKRMKSKTPKVLHKISGIPMIKKTFDMLVQSGAGQIIVVASPNNQDQIQKTLKNADMAIQKEPKGTADAARAGIEKVKGHIETIAVLYGDDSAFYKPQTIKNVFEKHQKDGSQITFVTLTKEDPSGLGRIVRKKGKLVAITEEKDATEAEKKIKEVNDGLYFFNKKWVEKNLKNLRPSPVTGELYITDLIELALRKREKIGTYLLKDEYQWHGINTKEQLIEANIKSAKKIHFMGISGSGASAAAGIAKAYGLSVSGCDLNPKSVYGPQKGIKVQKGHSPSHLKNKDLLVVSPAVLKFDPKNPEIKLAKSIMPVLTWQQFQGKVLQNKKYVIAVTGAYGKSTTTAMVSEIMLEQNLDPTCEIGARVISWSKNFRVGKSNYYVCEADEYNNNFLSYNPDVALILDIAWDHPDFFKTEANLLESYEKFVEKIKPEGTLIINKKAQEKLNIKRKDIKIVKINKHSIKLNLVGSFRKENADAALTLAESLNLNLEMAKKTLSSFKGLGRRLEEKGKVNSTAFWDDYAVQPYTILKTTNALAEKFKDKKLLLVLEPHTFSRIEKFFPEFVETLKKINCDKIFITEIYAAREKSEKSQTLSQKLADSVGEKAQYSGSLEKTAELIKKNLSGYDLILTMGAGNIYKLFDIVKNG